MQKRPSYSGMLWPNCSGLSFSWVSVVSLYNLPCACVCILWLNTLLLKIELQSVVRRAGIEFWLINSFWLILFSFCGIVYSDGHTTIRRSATLGYAFPFLISGCIFQMPGIHVYGLWKNVSVKLCHQCCGYKHWSCYSSDLFKECILISLLLSLLSVQTNSKVSATSLKQATSYEEFSLSLCFSAKLGFLCPLCFGSHSLTRVSSNMVSII